MGEIRLSNAASKIRELPLKLGGRENIKSAEEKLIPSTQVTENKRPPCATGFNCKYFQVRLGWVGCTQSKTPLRLLGECPAIPSQKTSRSYSLRQRKSGKEIRGDGVEGSRE